MEQACKIGIDRGDEEFRLFVNTYFDSKDYVPLSEFLNNYSAEDLLSFLRKLRESRITYSTLEEPVKVGDWKSG